MLTLTDFANGLCWRAHHFDEKNQRGLWHTRDAKRDLKQIRAWLEAGLLFEPGQVANAMDGNLWLTDAGMIEAGLVVVGSLQKELF